MTHTLHHILHNVCASARAGLLSVAGHGPKLVEQKKHWW